MPIDFKLPDLGENIESGDVVNVLVKEGDDIEAEQGVLELETGKAVVELPCPYAGRVTKLYVKKGSKVKVGEPLLAVEPKAGAPAPAAKEKSPAPKAAAPATKPSPPSEKKSAPAAKPQAAAKPAETRKPAAAPPKPSPTTSKQSPAPLAPNRHTPPAGPATRRLARELGVDIGQIEGSGSGGRVTEDDIKSAVRNRSASDAAAPAGPAIRTAPMPEGVDDRDAWGAIRRQAMSGIRKAIAVNMARSASTIPHVTNFDDADITELERIRKGGMAEFVDSNVKLTMMAFVTKAVAHSLRLHPTLNASIDMEKQEIIYKQYVNIGVAVDTDRGLLVPVMRGVDRMTIPSIAQSLTELAQRSRSGQFSLEDMRGSTFTISNMGAIGGTYSTPIINFPDVAILLVGRSRKMPVVVDERIEARLMMPLSISYDHRLVDGAEASRFLNEVIDYLETPGRLLLAP